jgi:ligand-binding SRPBCC domain-containing protein
MLPVAGERLLEREQFIARSLGEVFEFFAHARNLERITPPWLRFEVLTPEPIEMREGTRIDYRLRLHGIPLRWVLRIEMWEQERAFVDRQVRGPYALWHHLHEFESRDGGTLVRDRVRYALPLGRVGAIGLPLVRRDLDRIFAFRHAAVEQILA